MNFDPTLRGGDRIEVYTPGIEWRMATVARADRDEVTVIIDGRESQRPFPWFSARRPVNLVGRRLPLT